MREQWMWTRLRAASKIGLALFRKAADFRISRTPDLSRADLSHRILLQVRGMSLVRTILCRIPAEEQKVPIRRRLLPAAERRALMSVVPKTPSGGGEAHSYEPSARDAGAASGGSGGEPRTVTQNTIINQPPSYTPAQRIEVINDQSSGTPASGTPQTPSSPEYAPRSEGRQRDDGSRNGGGGPKPEEQGKGKKPPRVGPLRDKRK